MGVTTYFCVCTILLFLCVTITIAPAPIAPKHAFPLTNMSLGYDVKNGIGELYPAGTKEYTFNDDKPVDVNFASVVFNGRKSSFVEVPVSISNPDSNHYYTVTLYVKPSVAKNMSILAYESDDVTQGIVSMELWTDGTKLLASLKHSDGTTYSNTLYSYTLDVGRWTFIAFMRDQDDKHQRLEITVDSVHIKDTFDTKDIFVSNHRMYQSGKLRIGGSFKGRNTFEGEISCVMVVEDAVKSESENIGKTVYCQSTANWTFPPADYFGTKLLRPSGHFKLMQRDLSPKTSYDLGRKTVSSSRRCVDFCLKTSECASVLIISTNKTCILYERYDIYNFTPMPNSKYYIATSYV